MDPATAQASSNVKELSPAEAPVPPPPPSPPPPRILPVFVFESSSHIKGVIPFKTSRFESMIFIYGKRGVEVRDTANAAKLQGRFLKGEDVSLAALSEDERVAFIVVGGTVLVAMHLTAPVGEVFSSRRFDMTITALSVSPPDSEKNTVVIAVGTVGGNVSLCDPVTLETSVEGEICTRSINKILWAGNSFVVFSGQDAFYRDRRLEPVKPRFRDLGKSGGYSAVELSPSGQQFACGSRGVRLFRHENPSNYLAKALEDGVVSEKERRYARTLQQQFDFGVRLELIEAHKRDSAKQAEAAATAEVDAAAATEVNSVCWIDENLLLCCESGLDHRLVLFDVSIQQSVAVLGGLFGSAVSNCGRRIYCWSSIGIVEIFEVRDISDGEITAAVQESEQEQKQRSMVMKTVSTVKDEKEIHDSAAAKIPRATDSRESEHEAAAPGPRPLEPAASGNAASCSSCGAKDAKIAELEQKLHQLEEQQQPLHM